MNNRPIKFRAWSKTLKKMGKPFSPFLQDRNHGAVLFSQEELADEIILMQFTGLLDSEGKEIYEFDYLETGGTNVWWVRWGSGKYILQNISTGDIIDCNENHTQRNTVAGNSFESPRKHKAMETDL